MSEHEKSEAEKRVNVVDRRRFESDGRERGDEPAHETAPQSQSQSQSSPSAGEAVVASSTSTQNSGDVRKEFLMEPGGDSEDDSVPFTSFVMSLATQTMVQMGAMPAPAGMEIPVDVESARQTIEILAMLQRKTRGNLSSEEARFMEEVLHTLRTSYVRTKQG